MHRRNQDISILNTDFATNVDNDLETCEERSADTGEDICLDVGRDSRNCYYRSIGERRDDFYVDRLNITENKMKPNIYNKNNTTNINKNNTININKNNNMNNDHDEGNLSDFLHKNLESGLKNCKKVGTSEVNNYGEDKINKNSLKLNSKNYKGCFKMHSKKNPSNDIEMLASQSINKHFSFKNMHSLKNKYSDKSTFKTTSDLTQRNKYLSFFNQDTFSITWLSQIYKIIPKICGSLDLFFKNIDDENDFAKFLQKDIIRSLRINCIWTVAIAIIKCSVNVIFFPDMFYFVNDKSRIQFSIILRFAFLPICVCLLFASTYIPPFLPHIEIITSCLFTIMNLSYFAALGFCVQFSGNSSFSSTCEFPYLLEYSHALQLFLLYVALVLFIPIRALYLWPICATAPIAFSLKFATSSQKGKATYNAFSQSFYITILSIVVLIGKRIMERKTRFQYINIRQIRQKDEFYQQKNDDVNCSNAYDEVIFYLHSTIIKINSVVKFLMFKSNDLYEIMLNVRTDIEKCILKLSKLDNLLTVDKDALLSNLKENNLIIEHLFNTIYTKKHDHNVLLEPEMISRTPISIEDIVKKYRDGGRIDIISYKTLKEFERVLEKQSNYEKQNLKDSLFKINLCENIARNNRKLNTENYEEYVKIIKSINAALNKAFDGLGENWDFNMFELQNVLKDNTFTGVGMYFLDSYVEKLQCPNYFAYNFLYDIKETYLKKNKYHNSLHGADVCHSMLCILNNMTVFKDLDFYTQISTIIATLCHDVGHPGLTNTFLIKINHNLAIHYNDLSVLENYHSAITFFYLNKASNNFLVNISKSEFNLIRQIVVDLILATDLANHFEFLSIIKIRSKVEDFSILYNDNDNINFLKLCIKAADISHTCKPFNIHLLFVINLMLESYQQGEKEKLFNLPLLPFYDFEQIDKLPESQVGFISFICLDMFNELSHIEHLFKEYYISRDIRRGKTVKLDCFDEGKYETSVEKKHISDTTDRKGVDELIIHRSEDLQSSDKNEDINSKELSKDWKNDMFIQKFCLHHLKYNSLKWEKDKNLINIIKQYVVGEIKDEDILKVK